LGHETVAQAIADPVLRSWVEQWWDSATRHLTLPEGEIAQYRAELLNRFSNSRIRHQLSQIAVDGSQKIPVRVVPVVHADLAEGIVSEGAARVLASWILHLGGSGCPVKDVQESELRAATRDESMEERVGRILGRLGLHDKRVASTVLRALGPIESLALSREHEALLWGSANTWGRM
jgi:fructuronate reductase